MKTIDRELTRAGEAIRVARQQLPRRPWDSPGVRTSNRLASGRALAVAALAAVAVIGAIGLPALWLSVGDPTSGPGDSGQASPPTSVTYGPASSPVPAGSGFPLLTLTASGWSPTRVYDQTNTATGARVTSVEYVQQSEDGTGGTVTLAVQLEGHEDGLLAGLRSSGPSSEEMVTVAERAVRLFTFDDRLHAFHWIEAPSVEAAFVADGPTREEALTLFGQVEVITEERWLELVLAHPFTTTTFAPSP